MYQFNSEVNLIIQGCLSVIAIGVLYNIFFVSRFHSLGVRLLSVGVLLIALSSIERSLVNFSIIRSNMDMSMVQDVINVLALGFLGMAFSKLTSKKS